MKVANVIKDTWKEYPILSIFYLFCMIVTIGLFWQIIPIIIIVVLFFTILGVAVGGTFYLVSRLMS